MTRYDLKPFTLGHGSLLCVYFCKNWIKLCSWILGILLKDLIVGARWCWD